MARVYTADFIHKATILLCGALLLSSIAAKAQNITGSIQANIKDEKTGEALSHATVVVQKEKDSSTVKTALTDDHGFVQIKELPSGSYHLLVTYLGYKKLYKDFSISGEKPDLKLGEISLSNEDVSLETVVVKDKTPPVKILGDTLQFNAGSFKTRENAVVEDLLKKLPGVEVDKDGKITAQGEDVQQVYVDGKPFFGDDPKIATKNLPADIIDQVQLFDKTSDQAAFTGINDGNTSKAINLIIKKDKKKGLFGRATVGYGNDDRYQVNAMLNHFKGEQQISFIGGGNNVNNLGFSFNDIRSMSGGGGGGRGRGGRGGGGGGMIGPTGNGITTNWMGGLNYRDKWNPKMQVYGSYFANNTRSNAEQKSSRENIRPDTTFFYNENTISNNNSMNQRFNLNIEYDIDSMSSIVFRPSLSYTTNDYSNSNEYESLTGGKELVNNGNSTFSSHNTSPNLNGSLLYRRRLNKKGRTFSISMNGGYNSNDGTSYNKSESEYFRDADSSNNETINQQNQQNSHSDNWGTSLSYTEPIYKDHFLEIEYSHSENKSNSEKLAYNFNAASKGYDDYDSTYSNTFHNTFNTNRGSLNFIANKENYNYTVGVRMQKSLLTSDGSNRDTIIQQRTLNFSPLFNFHYKFSKYSRLRVNYNGSTREPSISQLQPVPDNRDPLNTRRGNPDLKPSFTNSVRLNYNTFNPETFNSLFASVDFSTVSNKIVNSSFYNDSGQQVITPMNVNGTYDIRGNFSLSLPVKTINLKIHPSTSVNYSKDAGFVADKKSIDIPLKNISENFSVRQRLSMSFDPNDNIDIDMGGSINYNNVAYSLQPDRNTHYINYNFSTDFEWHLPADFLIGADFDYTANTGLGEGYNQNVSMLNAYIGKEFFKKKQGLLKFQVFDLLNQNVSINRNIAANYIEDTENQVLSRYFLLTFTYNLNKFGGKRSRGDGPPPERRFRGGGGRRF